MLGKMEVWSDGIATIKIFGVFTTLAEKVKSELVAKDVDRIPFRGVLGQNDEVAWNRVLMQLVSCCKDSLDSLPCERK